MTQIFRIHSLSPMGEGIGHFEDKVYYVPKSAPGDEIEIIQSKRIKKDIYKVSSFHLIRPSEHRIHPACPHFQNCGGCDYQHLPYSWEINNKLQALFKNIKNRLTNQVTYPFIQVHNDNQRTHYRNRIQLQINQGKIGFMKKNSKQVQQINNCLLAEAPIQDFIQNKLPHIKLPQHGHIEIGLDQTRKPNYHLNKQYAFDGFTQVNQNGNKNLQQIVKDYYQKKKIKDSSNLIELFSGKGNLSRDIKYFFSRSYHFDYCDFDQEERENQFYKINLYDESLLSLLLQQNHKIKTESNHLILDPPRSGYKQLSEMVHALQPQSILYVSCYYSTLIRDISPLLDQYFLKEIHLIDMFPNTSHFETVFILEQKSN